MLDTLNPVNTILYTEHKCFPGELTDVLIRLDQKHCLCGSSDIASQISTHDSKQTKSLLDTLTQQRVPVRNEK